MSQYVFSPPWAPAYEALPVAASGDENKLFVNYPAPTEEQKNTTEVPSGVLEGAIRHRPSFAHAVITLKDNAVISDNGAMIWQLSENGAISINTGCHAGGCCSGAWRGCARENFCFNRYEGTGEVTFGFDLPGDILPFVCMPNQGWILTKGGFVCGTPGISVSAKWKGCQTWCCSGEGGFLTWIYTSTGNTELFFAGGFGMINKLEVPEGKSLYVNTGLFFAAVDDTPINVSIPGSCCPGFCCNGEDFVMVFTGPCIIYTQNRDPDVFMKLLNPIEQGQGGGESPGGDGG